MIKVIPAILSKTKEDFEEKINALKGLVDWVQIDITDGSYFDFNVPFKIEAHVLTKKEVDTSKADRTIIHQGQVSWANKNYVLVLAVEPGAVGGKFNLKMLKIIKELREKNNNIDIAVDGGVDADNAELIIKAGANILISNSYIFKNNNIKQNIHEIYDSGLRGSRRQYS